MTIRDFNKLRESTWDWGTLRGCFPRNIEPTDLDGFVEIGCKFLILETKLPSADLTRGQRDAFKALVSTGHFTVIVIWGKKDKDGIDQPERLLVMTSKEDYEGPADIDTLKEVCKRWGIYANKEPRQLRQSKDPKPLTDLINPIKVIDIGPRLAAEKIGENEPTRQLKLMILEERNPA